MGSIFSLDDLELAQVLSVTASLRPDQRSEFLKRVAAATVHVDRCSEGALDQAIALAHHVMFTAH
jgi:hypothetical protein